MRQGARRPCSVLSVAGIAAVSFLAGLATIALVTRGEGQTDVRQAPDRTPEAEPVLQGSHVEGPAADEMPSGFTRSSDGAVAAAAAYVTNGQALLDLDPLAAERAIREIAAEEYADRLAAETMEQLGAARDALADGRGPIVYRQAVIAYRVEAFNPDRARVAVWNVGVLTREGVAPPQAAWAISTFDLVWERGDWRIWAETIVPGPAPILNDSAAPTTAQQLVAMLDGFAGFVASA